MMRRLFSLATGQGPGARLSTLVFHRVLAAPDPIFPDEVDAERFDRICAWLRDWFDVLPLDQAARLLAEGRLPSRALTITFDDGYADNRVEAAPILRRHGLPATFFISTGMIDGGLMWNDRVYEALRRTRLPTVQLGALLPDVGELPTVSPLQRRAAIDRVIAAVKYLEPSARLRCVDEVLRLAEVEPPHDLMMSSAQVRELHAMGLQIGAHTVSHPILARLPASEAKLEIVESRRHLEAIVGEPVRLFAYPNGKPGEDYGARDVELVREAGFDAAVSTAWGVSTSTCDRFQLRRFSPWDRDRLRFALRLLGNIVRTAPGPGPLPVAAG